MDEEHMLYLSKDKWLKIDVKMVHLIQDCFPPIEKLEPLASLASVYGQLYSGCLKRFHPEQSQLDCTFVLKRFKKKISTTNFAEIIRQRYEEPLYDLTPVQEARFQQVAASYHLAPVVAAVYDCKGTYEILMTRLEGQTLFEWLSNTSVTRDQKVHVLEQCVDILRQLHTLPIYHNDVHNGNVFVTRDNKVQLIDFGRATAYTPHCKIHQELYAICELLVSLAGQRREPKVIKALQNDLPQVQHLMSLCELAPALKAKIEALFLENDVYETICDHLFQVYERESRFDRDFVITNLQKIGLVETMVDYENRITSLQSQVVAWLQAKTQIEAAYRQLLSSRT